MFTIGLEEHYLSQEFEPDYPRVNGEALNADLGALTEIGEGRIAILDKCGMGFQVLSHGLYPMFAHPQRLRNANNQVAQVIQDHPDRFAAFAALPFATVDDAVNELRRTVTELGFKGALINGTIDGRFLDAPEFEPLLAAATELGVPLYLHPAYPPKAVFDQYYVGNFDPWVGDALATTAGGWHFEVGLHVLRLIASGAFDRHPGLQIIIGHLGETLPFLRERIVNWMTPRATMLELPVTDYFRRNIWVTTSGYTDNSAFLLALETFGPDRVLFSVDYPYSPLQPAMDFVNQLPVDDETKERISWKNAAQLLAINVAESAAT